VPLLLKLPHGERGGTRVQDVVELVDIFPTILELAALHVPDNIDGQSLLPLAMGQAHSDGIAYTSRFFATGVRTANWKLIMNNDSNIFEAYNLNSDPLEQTNVALTSSDSNSGLHEKLTTFFATDPTGWHLLWNSGASGEDARIVISTEHRILKARTQTRGSEGWKSFPIENERGLELDTPGHSQLELLFETAAPTSRVTISVKSNAPFQINVAAEEALSTSAYTAILDPRETDFTNLATAVPLNKEPHLTLWRVTSDRTSGTARAMDSDEKAALEALGYAN